MLELARVTVVAFYVPSKLNTQLLSSKVFFAADEGPNRPHLPFAPSSDAEWLVEVLPPSSAGASALCDLLRTMFDVIGQVGVACENLLESHLRALGGVRGVFQLVRRYENMIG